MLLQSAKAADEELTGLEMVPGNLARCLIMVITQNSIAFLISANGSGHACSFDGGSRLTECMRGITPEQRRYRQGKVLMTRSIENSCEFGTHVGKVRRNCESMPIVKSDDIVRQ